MVEDEGAKNLDVKKVPKGGQFFAKHMEVVIDANTLVAQKALKAELITALPMVVADVASMKVAVMLQEVNLVYASSTEVGRDARRRIAQKVQKVILDSASLTVVVSAVNSHHAQRVHKGARCFARHMVVENGVLFWDAQKVPKGALYFARGMVEESGVYLTVVFAQRVCTVVPYSVWLMAVGRDVWLLHAPRVLEVGPVTVYVMVEANGASMKVVGKVRKGVLIFARPMEVANIVLGVGYIQMSALVMHHVTGFPEPKRVSVLHTIHCYKMNVIGERTLLLCFLLAVKRPSRLKRVPLQGKGYRTGVDLIRQRLLIAGWFRFQKAGFMEEISWQCLLPVLL